MLDPINTIQAINRTLEPFLVKGEGGNFYLKKYKSQNTFRLNVLGEYSLAYNDYGNHGEEVKVVKWFDDYWLFIEILFIYREEFNKNTEREKKYLKLKDVNAKKQDTKISLSIFQGNETDNIKNQLFRAEWDDYGELNNNHPQPHWHFYTNKFIERTITSFADIVSTEIQDSFKEVLNDEKRKIVDLTKFHFAMNGDWYNATTHTHSITNEESIARWFGGLLAHIKNELNYLENKRGR